MVVKQEVKFSPCNVCNKKEHIIEAIYCSRCGTKLDASIKYN